MPRSQGTSRKGKPKKTERASGMGRALERSQQKRRRRPKPAHEQGVGIGGGGGMASTGAPSIGLGDAADDDHYRSTSADGNDDRDRSRATRSVLEMDDLADFLAQSELAGRTFESERERFVVLDVAASEYRPIPTATGVIRGAEKKSVRWEDRREEDEKEEEERQTWEHKFRFRELGLPRRPSWDESTTPDELDRREKEAFVEWRRGIAAWEEELFHLASSRGGGGVKGGFAAVTPFEKNLEVWRQLWRVVERSDCVVQIVDGRNPLFYLSSDLRSYAESESGKPVLVLINKSDYLTAKQRAAWSAHFDRMGYEHVFFSAFAEQAKLDEEAREAKRRELLGDDADDPRLVHDDDDDDDEQEEKPDDDDEDESSSGSDDNDSDDDDDDDEFSSSSDDNDSDDDNDKKDVGEEASDINDRGRPASDPTAPTRGGNKDDCDGEDERSAAEPEKSLLRDDIGIQTPLTRAQLMEALVSFARRNNVEPSSSLRRGIGFAVDRNDDDVGGGGGGRGHCRYQFGMVGFPNVGKSSVINVLVGSSKHAHGRVRVGVASQPGKTKHFQTLLLPDRDDVALCDCPGLVFPSFASSTADLIAAGVYPIAQMRDHWPVVELICRRIPREVLNARYGMKIPEPSERELRERGWFDSTLSSSGGKGGGGHGKMMLPPPTAEELLGTYCVARSMMAAASGVPDYARAARIVVKDYVEGKLLYNHAPPPPPVPSPNSAAVGDNDSGGVGSAAAAEETATMDEAAFARETLLTALRNTRKLRDRLEAAAALEEKGGDRMKTKGREEGGDDMVEDDDSDEQDSQPDDIDILDAIGAKDASSAGNGGGGKRGKAHKSVKKWGKKGRKLRNKDPYGCHSSEPDAALEHAAAAGGVYVNAGKYGRAGYTRATYAGARAAEGVAVGGKKNGRKGRVAQRGIVGAH